MFPCREQRTDWRECLPRIRGGVSRRADEVRLFLQSSPHTRGCFFDFEDFYAWCEVFPAYAGVFRALRACISQRASLPRIRGGVSMRGVIQHQGVQSSPHTRGCFLSLSIYADGIKVFPAYAGVFPRRIASRRSPPRLPRIRGGVSKVRLQQVVPEKSSPHTRGCFPFRPAFFIRTEVFPAYAGVFLSLDSVSVHIVGLPRIRGGVSSAHRPWRCAYRSSPHTRGCF